MADSEFFSTEELLQRGFRSVGRHVRISRKTSLYAVQGSIGDHVRVDDFCILKGHVEIGSHVHICAFCSVSGARGRVTLSDFSTLSNRVSVFTGSDDYRADALSSSTVPEKYLKTIAGDVTLGRAALIGAHCVILPGVTVGDAASVGALATIFRSLPAGAVAVSRPPGVEIRAVRDVAKILQMAEELRAAEAGQEESA